jgi:hypothetical protein
MDSGLVTDVDTVVDAVVDTVADETVEENVRTEKNYGRRRRRKKQLLRWDPSFTTEHCDNIIQKK